MTGLVCDVAGCGEPAAENGLCAAHEEEADRELATGGVVPAGTTFVLGEGRGPCFIVGEHGLEPSFPRGQIVDSHDR